VSKDIGLIPRDKYHDKLLKSRMAKEASEIKVTRNYLAIAIIGLILACFALIRGWQVAEKRFAENVRVSYVKLSPNGSYNVEYEDENKPVDFFKTTVDSKLSEFVEKRFSKRKNTITYDYGFSNLFLSPQLSNQFLNDYKAAKVAAEHLSCVNCSDEVFEVRNLQGLAADVIPNTKDDQEYTTLVFARMKKISTEGFTTDCSNKMVTLLWHFRAKNEVVSKRDQLKFNPLGMEILRADIKNDPTPVSLAECVKN
jgi:hypothetical protein